MAEEEKNLIPVVEIPEFTEESEEYDTDYKPSLLWDLERGDFVRTATNKVPRSDGVTAYKVWCVKTVATERYACLAYSDDIGTEMENARQELDRNAVELAIKRTIEEALLVNPRTLSLENFLFRWEPGKVYVSFIVNAREEEPFVVDVAIDAE